MNVLGLCAGVGGLELGLHLAEPSANPVLFVEQDQFCQSVLKRRWPGVAIWTNVLTFDGRPWRRLIDVFTAGFPCQPWSLAGLGLGVEDERWFFPQIGELIRQVDPEWVFLENVPALIARGGLAIVLGTLADLGFDAVWGVFSCEQLGASHKRKRVFILGHARSRKLQRRGEQQSRPVPRREELARESGCGLPYQSRPEQTTLEYAHGLRGRGDRDSDSRHSQAQGPSETMVDSLRPGERPEEYHRTLDAAISPGEALADSDSNRCGEDLRRPRFPRDGFSWPPGPEGSWECIPRELWPAQPKVRAVADGVPRRVDPDRRKRLRALGNAVSPPVAAVAWRVLKERLLG